MRAYSLIRDKPWYRSQAFEAGLKRTGYKVLARQPDRARVGDVLLIWNRYSHWHEIAARFEREGGTVVVAENGYIGLGGVEPKFDVHPSGPKPESYYALALGWHNGRGRWHVGGPDRLNALGLHLKPWRAGGEYILICPNRSFGVGEQMMHPDWAERCAARIAKETKHPIRIRRHPGNDEPKRKLAEDLPGAAAVVIWSSSCGVHALADGIPVVCEAPYWICKSAAFDSFAAVATLTPETALHRDNYRRSAFERMAWAQWQCQEIETGEPFNHLLSATRQSAVAGGS